MSVQIVASECCAGRYPQNTAAGFAYCLQRAFDGIEFDVHLSADGYVVVHHDYRLNPRIARDRSGDWVKAPAPAICTLTLAELQTYDVGRYRPGSRELTEYPDCRALDGAVIPTLRDLLRGYVDGNAGATLWIEIKTTPFQRDISSQPNELVSADRRRRNCGGTAAPDRSARVRVGHIVVRPLDQQRDRNRFSDDRSRARRAR